MSNPEKEKKLNLYQRLPGPDAGRDKIIRIVPDIVAGDSPIWRDGKKKKRTGCDFRWTIPLFLNQKVPEEGLEPSCPRGRQILSLVRLPFRHSGMWSRVSAEKQPNKIARNPQKIKRSREKRRKYPVRAHDQGMD